MNNPTPAQIKSFRKSVQEKQSLNITAAQDWCAEQLYKNRRTWQKWENAERKMDPAYWEYVQIKLIQSS